MLYPSISSLIVTSLLRYNISIEIHGIERLDSINFVFLGPRIHDARCLLFVLAQGRLVGN